MVNTKKKEFIEMDINGKKAINPAKRDDTDQSGGEEPENGDVATGNPSSDYIPGTSPAELGEVDALDIDGTYNEMSSKTYTVFREDPKEYLCPVAHRDNVADQFTP